MRARPLLLRQRGRGKIVGPVAVMPNVSGNSKHVVGAPSVAV